MAISSFATAFSPVFLLEKRDMKTITFKKRGIFEDELERIKDKHSAYGVVEPVF